MSFACYQDRRSSSSRDIHCVLRGSLAVPSVCVPSAASTLMDMTRSEGCCWTRHTWVERSRTWLNAVDNSRQLGYSRRCRASTIDRIIDIANGEVTLHMPRGRALHSIRGSSCSKRRVKNYALLVYSYTCAYTGRFDEMATTVGGSTLLRRRSSSPARPTLNLILLSKEKQQGRVL